MTEFEKLLADLRVVQSGGADRGTIMKAMLHDIAELGKRMPAAPPDRRPELRDALLKADTALSAAVASGTMSAHEVALVEGRLENLRAAVRRLGA